MHDVRIAEIRAQYEEIDESLDGMVHMRLRSDWAMDYAIELLDALVAEHNRFDIVEAWLKVMRADLDGLHKHFGQLHGLYMRTATAHKEDMDKRGSAKAGE